MRPTRRPVVHRVGLLALLAFVALAPLGAQSARDAVFPGAAWEHVAQDQLPAYGWSPERLKATRDFIRDESNTTGLVVVDRGRVVFTYGDVEELSYVASVRKSILAMLYGAWVDNGTIKLDTTLAALGMDDIGGLSAGEKQATIEHVITARSGVFHPASYSGDDLAKAPPRQSQKPGGYMLYSNWDFNAAGHVFELLTRRSIYDELQGQLAVPLQFQDWDRKAQHKEGDLTISQYPAYPIWISTRDMARIGYLMLHEGNWNGTQVIAKAWAKRIVSVVTPVTQMNPAERRNGPYGYGYMWWVWDGPKATGPYRGAYSAIGAVGQWIAVFPAINVVVAHKTHNVYGRTTASASFDQILERLFAAKGISAGAAP